MLHRQTLIFSRQIFNHLMLPTSIINRQRPLSISTKSTRKMDNLPTTYSGKLPSPPPLTETPLIPHPDAVPIAIIGGTGLSSLPSPPFTPLALIPPILTPWGLSSSPIAILSYTPPAPSTGLPTSSASKPTIVAFLARHGEHHQYAPHEIPNRANVAALKKLGVEAAVGFSAVGSLREEVKPRDFLVAGGVVDWTKGVSSVWKLWAGYERTNERTLSA